MVDLGSVPVQAFTSRLLTVFFTSFIVIIITARIIGSEKKARWFKRRSNYTLLNRRGIFGEYLNFGYPRTWQGMVTAILMYGLIFGAGFWYLFIHPYA